MTERQQPAGSVWVALIPENGLKFRTDHKFTGTDSDGKFQLQNVPPGDYKIYAWENIEAFDWQEPKIMRAYESRGTAVHTRSTRHRRGKRRLEIRCRGLLTNSPPRGGGVAARSRKSRSVISSFRRGGVVQHYLTTPPVRSSRKLREFLDATPPAEEGPMPPLLAEARSVLP